MQRAGLWVPGARLGLTAILIAVATACGAAEGVCARPLVSSQRPAQKAPAPLTPAAGTAAISGTIRNAIDDTPLGRARVVVASAALPAPRVAISAADGTYAVAGLAAGAYTVAVTRTGFAPGVYRQAPGIGAASSIALSEGQRAGKIDVALSPGGAIVGRILDEDGSAFAGAIVNALATRNDQGTDLLVSAATAETDDRGEFRLYGLAPGEYYVSASDPAFRSISTPEGVQHYSPTYAPGTTFVDRAEPVRVAEAGAPPRVEFRLVLTPPARVSGQIASFDGKPLLNGTLIMTATAADGVPIVAPQDSSLLPSLLPDGHFLFDHVSPGRYEIRARGQTGSDGQALFAMFATTVNGVDVQGIRMTLQPGGLIDGTLTIDRRRSASPPGFSSLVVRAPFTDGNTFGDVPAGTVASDGRFAIRGIMTGAHQIVVEGLQPPWVVREVSRHGTDLTDLPIDIEGRDELRDVSVVITDASSIVTGTVRNATQHPVAHAGVMLFSSAPAFWMRTSRRVRVAYTDDDGRFSVVGLPAGDYLAVAALTIDESDLGRPHRLAAFAHVATPLRLTADDGRASVDLQIPPAPPAAAAVR
ncbi:MAG: carboxypeptidase regulatory-like domain-containing protein [Vicinamibacterales bacterium]